ncbi:DUF4142 domain-containing protein (plasmid) [Novosphingobium aerophilum]|uniref:DUF4142 domain-containing protein n=1 Tax=Sphingomonadales TaxID=204457 RepID=UPI0026EE2D21|nr:DUF4142 domain-containing protein [Sphingobium yanoikuyae]
MKPLLLVSLSAAALCLSACGKKAEPVENTAATSAAEPAAPAPAVLSPGQAFANTAAASDAFEIETSKLAASKAQSAKIKSFAEQMIKAHTDSTAKLKTAAAAATPAITPDAALTPAQQQELADLQTKSGAEFNRAYARLQADGHQKTLNALKAYAASGDVASLKTFASELVPIVTAHLNMAKGL